MLEVRNISYTVAEKDILCEISFVAKPGKLTIVLGPNGAGKSTLFKLISREIRIMYGDILFNGLELSQYSVGEMALQRAVMTQNIHLAGHYQVREVVMMGRYPHFKNTPHARDMEAVEQALEMTGLQGYEQRQYQSLSGGEQQRVQFARVLAQMNSDTAKPKLLLLDEPLNNLDVKYQHQLLETVTGFARKGHIVMAVLHDINLATLYADELLLLKKGKQLAFGEPVHVIQEKTIGECYDFPVKITEHPYHSRPVVHFGYNKTIHRETTEKYLSYDTQIKF